MVGIFRWRLSPSFPPLFSPYHFTLTSRFLDLPSLPCGRFGGVQMAFSLLQFGTYCVCVCKKHGTAYPIHYPGEELVQGAPTVGSSSNRLIQIRVGDATFSLLAFAFNMMKVRWAKLCLVSAFSIGSLPPLLQLSSFCSLLPSAIPISLSATLARVERRSSSSRN